MGNPTVKIRKATKQAVNRRKGIHLDTLRVAAYARVSTDSEEQLESYQSQVRHYTELINSKPEWQFMEVYAEMKIAYLIQKAETKYRRNRRNKGLSAH